MTAVHAEDPVLQSRETVQKVPSLCLCSTVHSQDEPSEPVEAPGCDSGRDGGTGSTTMSKSDTFQGPGGFRTPSAPGRVPPQPHTHSKKRHVMKTRQHRHMREEEKGEGHSLHNTGRE